MNDNERTFGEQLTDWEGASANSSAETATPIASESSQDSQQPAVPDDLEKKLLDLEQKCAELEDQLKRSLADYQNLQRRVQQERQTMTTYGAENALRAMLPSFDNFYYAWRSEQNRADPQQFIASLEMIWGNLLKSLESTVGLRVLAPEQGSAFDPNYHEAVLQMPSEEYAAGAVAEILSPGYCLLDRVLKPAQVAVALPKEAPAG